MAPFSLISLEDRINGWCMVDLVAIGTAAIIPRISITPSRRNRSSSPESHCECPIRTVAPLIRIAGDGTTHIEALGFGSFRIWRAR